MKSLIFYYLILTFFLFSNCSFQMDLFNEMNKNYTGKNLVISPFSLYQVLSLATNGANGETQEELLSLLNSEDLEELNEINYDLLDIFKEFSTVEVANALMVRDFSPVEDFVEISEKYMAPVRKLESANQINEWCSEKTHGKINKLIEKLDDDIILFILNAVYFKGEWTTKFNKGVTSKKPFYNLGLERNQELIDTMHLLTHFNFYENDELKIIRLPYRQDGMESLIILPKEKKDINEFIEKFDENSYKELLSTLKLSYKKVDLELPKFEIQFGEKLKKILINMGMKRAFSFDTADFSNLIEENVLKVDEIYHKTYLKVNEDGAEASAVTGMGGGGGAGAPVEEEIFEMKVNRPFLFMIRSRLLPSDHDLLFMSKIEEIKNK